MIATFSEGTIELSPQVSECLSLDFSFFPFIKTSISQHRSGDFGIIEGEQFDICLQSYMFGGMYYSLFEFGLDTSPLHGQQLLILSPRSRDTLFVSFMGEQF